MRLPPMPYYITEVQNPSPIFGISLYAE